jgi:hypothetical protein
MNALVDAQLTSSIDDVLIALVLAKGTHARRQALGYVSRAFCRLRGGVRFWWPLIILDGFFAPFEGRDDRTPSREYYRLVQARLAFYPPKTYVKKFGFSLQPGGERDRKHFFSGACCSEQLLVNPIWLENDPIQALSQLRILRCDARDIVIATRQTTASKSWNGPPC